MKTATMTKKQWKKEMELRNALALGRVADISIHDAFGLLDTFRRYERKLQRLAELSCNGYPMPKIEYRDGKMYSYSVEDVKLRERSEKREAKIKAEVKALALAHNLTVDFQGDPRGLMFSVKGYGQEINFYQAA